ncbi:YaeQ family protein [Marinobacter sp. M216]|uniref:YaeQ family protein n=1 Tax=Marinobacter albus TaxID=3030833 RepID=A0ABT7HEH0_9GAMM|nr:YaeQ family protein [Marinobacter sp. M216]MDK9558765.1 YaeQ family protein [Marinobacter sp. M216]
MALKATIFKATLSIADMDRHYYADHHLTIAQHPSETDERMMIRLLAFALNADEHLEFTKGLSTDDEPELWRKSLSDEIELWIELGLPEEGRLRKACNRAKQVILYTYGGRAVPLWWEKHHHKLERFGNLTVIDLPQESTAALASLAQRGMSLQITVQDGVVGVADDTQHVQVEPAPLT